MDLNDASNSSDPHGLQWRRERIKREVKGYARQSSAQGWVDSCLQSLEHQNMVPFFISLEGEWLLSVGLSRYV